MVVQWEDLTFPLRIQNCSFARAIDCSFPQREFRMCIFRRNSRVIEFSPVRIVGHLTDSSNGARVSRPLDRNITNSSKKCAEVPVVELSECDFSMGLL